MSNKEVLQDLITKYTEKQPAASVTALTGQMVDLVEAQAAEIKKLRDEAFEPYETEQLLTKLGVKVLMNQHPLAVVGLAHTLMKAQADEIEALKNTVANIQPLTNMLAYLGIPMEGKDLDYTLGVAVSHLKVQDDQIKGLQTSQAAVPNFGHLMDALLLAIPDQNPLIDYNAATLVDMATKVIKHQHQQVQVLTGKLTAAPTVIEDKAVGWIDLPLLKHTLSDLNYPVPSTATPAHAVNTAIEVLRAQQCDLHQLRKQVAVSSTKNYELGDPKTYSIDKLVAALNYVNVSGHDLDVVVMAMNSLTVQKKIIAEYGEEYKKPVALHSVNNKMDTATLLWLSLMVRGEMQIDRQVMEQLPTPERRELIAWEDPQQMRYIIQAKLKPVAKKPELPF